MSWPKPVRERLVANPIKGPRRHTLHTKLGRLLARRGVKVWLFAQTAGIHPRMMTEYLSGRKQPPEAAVQQMARCLSVRPCDIVESRYPYTERDYERECAGEEIVVHKPAQAPEPVSRESLSVGLRGLAL